MTVGIEAEEGEEIMIQIPERLIFIRDARQILFTKEPFSVIWARYILQ